MMIDLKMCLMKSIVEIVRRRKLAINAGDRWMKKLVQTAHEKTTLLKIINGDIHLHQAYYFSGEGGILPQNKWLDKTV